MGWGGCLQTTVKVWRLRLHRGDASMHEVGDRAPESNGLHVAGWLGSHSRPWEQDPLDTGAVSKKTRWVCFCSIQEITAVVMEKGVNGTPCTWETHPHGQMAATLTSGHPELISYTWEKALGPAQCFLTDVLFPPLHVTQRHCSLRPNTRIGKVPVFSLKKEHGSIA